MRRLMLCLSALALVAAGCGDDDDAAPTTTTTEAVTTTSEEVTTSSTTLVEDETTTTASAELGASCDSPDGFTVSFPEEWEAVADCGQFGPAPLDEPAPNTDERTGVVMAFIDPVPFEEVSEPTEGDRDRREETVDGRPAVRVEGAQATIGLYPEGTEYARWLVDVDGQRTLFLDAYDLAFDIDFDDAVEVLDQMVETVDIDR
jgi:hypothetical protein